MFENLTWQNRADRSIAHGALTNSKRPECFVEGIYPTHVKRGQGVKLYDDAGNSWIDYVCGLGSNLLGYGNPNIRKAVMDGYDLGSNLSLSSTLEVETAERFQQLFPAIDRLRFLKSGSDACMAAIRIARAYTGRSKVLSAGYHGFHDIFTSLTPPALGVTDEHDIQKLVEIDQVDDQTACVIVEPVDLFWGKERIHQLQILRDYCDKHGVVLIFDEIITGFRFEDIAVSKNIGINPDLMCLGKTIGAGLPLSVVGGRKEIMECGQYFISQTHAGEMLSLAASNEFLHMVQKGDVSINYLWEKAGYFRDRFNDLGSSIKIKGYNTRGRFEGTDLDKALFFQETCKAGLLFGPSWFYALPHEEFDDLTLGICREIIHRIDHKSVKLEGQMPRSPFAQKVRE